MRLFYLALLLASACGQPAGRDVAPPGPEQVLIPEPAARAPAEMESAALRARAERALRTAISSDPGPELRALRPGARGAICGEVSAGGPTAAFRPFVVSPSGEALLAKSARLDFSDTADTFVDVWIEYCATADDLAGLPPPADAATLPEVPLPPPPSPIDPLPADDPLDETAVGSDAEEFKAGPQPTINSFIDAVRKK
jgi:hypothetical protein